MKKIWALSLLVAIALGTSACGAGAPDAAAPQSAAASQPDLSTETLGADASRILKEFPQIVSIETSGAELEGNNGVATYTIFTEDDALLSDPQLNTTLGIDESVRIVFAEAGAAGT